MTSLVRYPGPGCIVEFLHGNKTHVAWVLDEQKGRYRVLTANRRESKLPANRLLPWSGPAHGTGLNREEITNLLAKHEEKREQLAAEIDAIELWELAEGDVPRANVEWFAGLIWDELDADHVAAMGRRMIEQKTHFKFQPPEFEVYTAERVEARMVEEEARKRRERIVNAGHSFFHALWDARTKGRKAPEPPEQELADKLRDVLFAAMGDTSGSPELTIWNAVKKGLPDDPLLPMFLGQTWGIIPEHFNIHLMTEGYEWGDAWSSRYAEELEELTAAFEKAKQPPLDLPLVSIDSPTTLDIDDAFHVEPTSDGGYKLTLAFARPTVGFDFASPLGRAVRERASSIYLPEGTSHMLPESHGIKLFSLTQGDERPAIMLEAILNADAEPVSVTPSLAWVNVAENSTYEAMEADLDSDTPNPQFALAAELGAKLRQRRIDGGAVVVDRPDPAITLEGEGATTRVVISKREAYPRAQVAVSEFMIFANSMFGRYGADNNIPMLYRTQDVTLPGDAAGVWHEPEDCYRVVRLMAPTCQELVPRKHATIGAKAYAPLTSPIRRYTDLINLAQMESYIESGAPKWTTEDIQLMLPHITARTEAAGRIQRFRPRYWKLLYLKQHKKEMHEAVVVDGGDIVNLALPLIQLYVRCPRKLLGDKIFPGQRFQVRFGKADPLSNEMRIAEAWEE